MQNPRKLEETLTWRAKRNAFVSPSPVINQQVEIGAAGGKAMVGVPGVAFPVFCIRIVICPVYRHGSGQATAVAVSVSHDRRCVKTVAFAVPLLGIGRDGRSLQRFQPRAFVLIGAEEMRIRAGRPAAIKTAYRHITARFEAAPGAEETAAWPLSTNACSPSSLL